VHCVRVAGAKVDNWWLRQHPNVRALKFNEGVKRVDVANAIDQYVTGGADSGGGAEVAPSWMALVETAPGPMDEVGDERRPCRGDGGRGGNLDCTITPPIL